MFNRKLKETWNSSYSDQDFCNNFTAEELMSTQSKHWKQTLTYSYLFFKTTQSNKLQKSERIPIKQQSNKPADSYRPITLL